MPIFFSFLSAFGFRGEDETIPGRRVIFSPASEKLAESPVDKSLGIVSRTPERSPQRHRFLSNFLGSD
jgi:hypothetical protein